MTTPSELIADQACVILSYAECVMLKKTCDNRLERPILHGVHVRQNVVEATNGHTLVQFPTRMSDGGSVPDFGPFLLRPEYLEFVTFRKNRELRVKVPPAGESEFEVWVFENDSTEETPNAPLMMLASESRLAEHYPDTSKVIPEKDSGDIICVGVDGGYLKQLAELAIDAGGFNERIELTIERSKTGGRFTERPIRFECKSLGASGLIMPLRMLDD